MLSRWRGMGMAFVSGEKRDNATANQRGDHAGAAMHDCPRGHQREEERADARHARFVGGRRIGEGVPNKCGY